MISDKTSGMGHTRWSVFVLRHYPIDPCSGRAGAKQFAVCMCEASWCCQQLECNSRPGTPNHSSTTAFTCGQEGTPCCSLNPSSVSSVYKYLYITTVLYCIQVVYITILDLQGKPMRASHCQNRAECRQHLLRNMSVCHTKVSEGVGMLSAKHGLSGKHGLF